MLNVVLPVQPKEALSQEMYKRDSRLRVMRGTGLSWFGVMLLRSTGQLGCRVNHSCIHPEQNACSHCGAYKKIKSLKLSSVTNPDRSQSLVYPPPIVCYLMCKFIYLFSRRFSTKLFSHHLEGPRLVGWQITIVYILISVQFLPIGQLCYSNDTVSAAHVY